MKDAIAPAAVETPRTSVMASASATKETVSTLGAGMLVTGNIVCSGALEIHGQVVGDIHAGHLTVCEGARVDGKIVAPETVICGTFNGSIHGNVVKLKKSASVDGEVYNRSLSIEQDARFEGIARRLDQAVSAPTKEQLAPGSTLAPAPVMDLEPAMEMPQQHTGGMAHNGANGAMPMPSSNGFVPSY